MIQQVISSDLSPNDRPGLRHAGPVALGCSLYNHAMADTYGQNLVDPKRAKKDGAAPKRQRKTGT